MELFSSNLSQSPSLVLSEVILYVPIQYSKIFIIYLVLFHVFNIYMCVDLTRFGLEILKISHIKEIQNKEYIEFYLEFVPLFLSRLNLNEYLFELTY